MIATIKNPQNFIYLNAKQNAALTADRIGRVLFGFDNQAIGRVLDDFLTFDKR